MNPALPKNFRMIKNTEAGQGFRYRYRKEGRGEKAQQAI